MSHHETSLLGDLESENNFAFSLLQKRQKPGNQASGAKKPRHPEPRNPGTRIQETQAPGARKTRFKELRNPSARSQETRLQELGNPVARSQENQALGARKTRH
jgi:hypothetical protein